MGVLYSLFIFVLTMEPLLCAICSTSAIQGFSTQSSQHKVFDYANDLLFSLTRPKTTLPARMAQLQHFSQLSNSAGLNLSNLFNGLPRISVTQAPLPPGSTSSL